MLPLHRHQDECATVICQSAGYRAAPAWRARPERVAQALVLYDRTRVYLRQLVLLAIRTAPGHSPGSCDVTIRVFPHHDISVDKLAVFQRIVQQASLGHTARLAISSLCVARAK
jgi:hypothetical protein